MREDWAGSFVSINCGSEKGVFQGQIDHVDSTQQTIVLRKVFLDGMPHPLDEVVINASDIVELKLIKSREDIPDASSTSTVRVTKPVPKRPVRSLSECLPSNKEPQLSESPRKQPGDMSNRVNGDPTRTPSKKDRNRQKWTDRDEECFGTPVGSIPDCEFDFEKNLALFDKQAVYDEINASQRPDVVRHLDAARRTTKYRHDENIIVGIAGSSRRIIVPLHGTKEYVTDDGLIIPSITPELRYELFASAKRCGLTEERQAELIGRCVTEMALHLLGGSHRLHPSNVQKQPSVAILCGSGRQGVLGVNCARQMACHGIETIVLLLKSDRLDSHLKEELSLYKLTNNPLVTSVHDLPSSGVDLIILGLADWNDDPWPASIFRPATSWASESRAPILLLDPPTTGIPGVTAKFSVLPALPLPHCPENGKLYLCDLAIPDGVYSDVGIEYVSPFGSKFVIPLYPSGS